MGNRASADDYDADFKLAKAAGIDAFALNVAPSRVDTFTNDQLNFAYDSADRNGMKAFISFDFNFYNPSTHPDDVADMAGKIVNMSSHAAQLKVGDTGRVFASTFIGGDKLDPQALRDQAQGVDIFFVPNFIPGVDPDFPNGLDGAFNFVGWDNNCHNKAPVPGGEFCNVVGTDGFFKDKLGADKVFMARKFAC